MAQITVQDVNKDVFREFKAEATGHGMKVGIALAFAMMKFKSELGPWPKFTSLKPVSWEMSKNRCAVNYINSPLFAKSCAGKSRK